MAISCKKPAINLREEEVAGNNLAGEHNPQLNAELKANRNTIADARFKETVSAIGNTGATQTFDLEVANVFTATLDQASTFTFSNPPTTGSGGGLSIMLTNPGAFTITWPASVDWEEGVEPTWTVSGLDILGFYTIDAGTTWLGKQGMSNVS